MPRRSDEAFAAKRPQERSRYAANKAKGLCAHCGERPLYPGLVRWRPASARA